MDEAMFLGNEMAQDYRYKLVLEGNGLGPTK